MRKKRRGRETANGYNIMFAYNGMEVGVSEVKAAGYDKLLAYRVEGRLSSRRVEGVMNRLQVYHPAPRDDGMDRDICILESVLRARERGRIIPVNKKIGPNKSRSGYTPNKEKLRMITIMTTTMRGWAMRIWTSRLPVGWRGIWCGRTEGP